MPSNRAIARPNVTSKNAKISTDRADQLAQLQRADELITHQHVVRRFKSRHKAEFEQLCELRAEISSLVKAGAVQTRNAPGIYPQRRLLGEATNFLGKRKHLLLLKNRKLDEVEALFRQDIERTFYIHSVGWVIADEAIQKLIAAYSYFAPKVIDIHDRLNFLDYYGPFGLTCLVPGEKIYTHYIKAMYGKLGITRYAKDNPGSVANESLLLHLTFNEKSDDEISCLLDGIPYKPWYPSKNVEVFGGTQHTVRVDDTVLENRLILSVPTDEAPDRIDDALQAFRTALLQEYEMNCGSYYNVSTQEFANSYFMNQRSYTPCLVKKWDQFQLSIVGLWAWDLCWTKESPDHASGAVMERMLQIHKSLPGTPTTYTEQSIKTYYNKSAKEIRVSPFQQKTQWAGSTKIDEHVTRTYGLVLGERDN